MNRDRLLKASFFAVLALGEKPSVRSMGEMYKRITGRGIRLDDVRIWLSLNRDTDGIRTEYNRDTDSNTAPDTSVKNEKRIQGYTPGHESSRDEDTNREPSRARHKVLKLKEYINTPIAKKAKSERRAREAKPLPPIPAEFADDIDRLAANDAAERRDGKIADSVLEQGTTMLRRAFEAKGMDALREGIDVAIRKGKGLKYAAGCVRNASGESSKPQLHITEQFPRDSAGRPIPPKNQRPPGHIVSVLPS